MSVAGENFDPYRKWLGIPAEEQPPHYYRLLGLRPFEADLDVISNAADRCMGHVRTFQSGAQVEACQRMLNELAAARLCLLGANTKAQYDQHLHARLNAPVQAVTPVAMAVASGAVATATPVSAVPVTAAPVTAVRVSAIAAPQAEVGIRTAATSPAVRRVRRKRMSTMPMVLGGVACLALLGGLFAVVLAKQGTSSQDKEKPRTVIITVPAETPSKATPKKATPKNDSIWTDTPRRSMPAGEPRYESSDELYDSVDGRMQRRLIPIE